VDVVAGAENGLLSWTQRWPEQDSWLGYNVDVKVEVV
jgi:hypothetical protein